MRGIVLVLLLTISQLGMAQTISVFYNNQASIIPNIQTTKIKQFKVQYYNLDQLQMVMNIMNKKLSGSDSELAYNNAQLLINHYRPEIKHAVKGLNLAQRYHISMVPTVVFNQGQYIIKNQANIFMAIDQYRQWSERHA
ncbi:MAG: DUF1525 domain-containing protein [Candidatus Cloacimonetes bacterium]|jgi:hypothetical protein|nr:DUF1525 domain-containing protein [Candidatus Cloacimonadota bacterium]